jgi:hypothetical protein
MRWCNKLRRSTSFPVDVSICILAQGISAGSFILRHPAQHPAAARFRPARCIPFQAGRKILALLITLLPFAAPAFSAPPADLPKAIEQAVGESGRSFSELIQPIVLSRDAKQGLAFDEVVDSVKLRANKLNLTSAGASHLPRPVQGDAKVAPGGFRAVILGFCDPELAIEMLALVPEFAVFLPCRVAVVQDRSGKIRVMTIDWRTEWFAAPKAQPRIPSELLTRLRSLLANISDVVESGARGDL